jgi:Tfp pilus assembly protein PilF
MRDAREACRNAINSEENGDFAAAIRHYSDAIELDPDWSDVYLFRGSVFAKQGNLDLAISDFSNAIQLNPHDADAFQRRASAYERQGESSRAEADFSKSEELRRRRL